LTFTSLIKSILNEEIDKIFPRMSKMEDEVDRLINSLFRDVNLLKEKLDSKYLMMTRSVMKRGQRYKTFLHNLRVIS
jgi:hypothetical protein